MSALTLFFGPFSLCEIPHVFVMCLLSPINKAFIGTVVIFGTAGIIWGLFEGWKAKRKSRSQQEIISQWIGHFLVTSCDCDMNLAIPTEDLAVAFAKRLHLDYATFDHHHFHQEMYARGFKQAAGQYRQGDGSFLTCMVWERVALKLTAEESK